MENYSQTLNELFDLQKFAIKLGLDNIRFLCEKMGNPQQAYPTIHIAGTNGKGSTAFYIAQILQAHGLRSGLFTSPHLSDFRERIRIDNRLIDRRQVVSFWQELKPQVMQRKATFFDTTTAMALGYFQQQKVDVAVVETGLGGRLDSTNLLRPQIAVITPIAFDHQKQLGHTLSSISKEKAGIIKKGCIVFSAAQATEAFQTLQKYAQKAKAFYYLPDIACYEIRRRSLHFTEFDLFDRHRNLTFKALRTLQVGDFQIGNIALAYQVSRFYLESLGHSFSEQKLGRVLKQRRWPGRLQLIQENPAVILDVSHNLHGVRHSLGYLAKLADIKKLVVLVGLVDDKNYPAIAREIARHAGRIIITEPETQRRLPAELLQKAFNGRNNVKLIKELAEAYEFSVNSLQPDETLLVMGSHYLTGAVMKLPV